MSYVRFGLMILTSTVVMFVLMYLNTYAWEHVFLSETRTYMAIMMGAAMAVIMLAYMLGMYENTALNIAIFVGAIILFGASLWLVRSQVTVSGTSYMRAMIPHHSIAIMTSERAGITDARVAKLAEEIAEAQRREIAEMRYLIGQTAAGDTTDTVYEDPEAAPGSLSDALSRPLISQLDLSPISQDEAGQVLSGPASCTFNRSPEADPILWGDENGPAAIKLNGTLIALDAVDDPQAGTAVFGADGVTVAVQRLGDAADWRQNADLLFTLDEGLRVGYRGFFACDPS
jgi:hypothetical protein